ncbi:MAG: hypothetical protein RLZZ204_589 [Bacteroidota bacterium]|jgi:hypothetical protein
MKNKFILALLPLFFLVLNLQAAIFVPQTSISNNIIVESSNTSFVEGPITKSKDSKRAKKVKEDKKEKTDRFALWGFITSVAGLASFFILPALALVLVPVGLGLSIAGLSRTRKNNSTGKGLAIAGLVAGSAGIFLLLLGVILAIAFLSNL